MKSSRAGESIIGRDVEAWPTILISSRIIGTGTSASIWVSSKLWAHLSPARIGVFGE
jgi:hypothetical protein